MQIIDKQGLWDYNTYKTITRRGETMVIQCACGMKFHQKRVKVNKDGIMDIKGAFKDYRFLSSSGESLKDHVKKHDENGKNLPMEII